MDSRAWLRRRKWVSLGLAICLGCVPIGCSRADDPEKPENLGTNSEANPTTAAESPVGPTPAELQRRAAEASKKIDQLRNAVDSDPTNAQNLQALGRALHEANRRDEAIPHLERAAELDPSLRTLIDLAIGYSGAARLDDAERTYERVFELVPDFPIALHNLGTLAHRRGNYAQAVTYYNRALEQQPNYLLARLHLGDSLKASDRLEEAYRAYEQVLELEPTNSPEASGYVDALYKLAALDLKMGAHERAGQFLTELIRMAPNHNKAYYAYGQVLLHMGYPEEAQKAFDKHIRILATEEPDSPAAMGE